MSKQLETGKAYQLICNDKSCGLTLAGKIHNYGIDAHGIFSSKLKMNHNDILIVMKELTLLYKVLLGDKIGYFYKNILNIKESNIKFIEI